MARPKASLTSTAADRTRTLLESEGQGDGVYVEGVYVLGVYRATPVTLRDKADLETEE